MSIKGFLTTKEVAKRLVVSVGRVQQFIAEGRLPATKVGQTNLVKESDLKSLVIKKRGRPPMSDVKFSGVLPCFENRRRRFI
jgi:excisionase family DNA binding protein